MRVFSYRKVVKNAAALLTLEHYLLADISKQKNYLGLGEGSVGNVLSVQA